MSKFQCNSKNHLGTVIVKSVAVSVGPSGEIATIIKSKPAARFPKLFPTKENSRKREFLCEHISVGDSFDVHLKKDQDGEVEIWKPSFQFPKDENSVTLNDPPKLCPSCKSVLYDDETGIYCINTRCPAKLIVSLGLFLSFLNFDWVGTKFTKILPSMVTHGTVQKISDIFKCDLSILMAYGLEPDEAQTFLKWIKTKKKALKYSQYLEYLIRVFLNTSEGRLFPKDVPWVLHHKELQMDFDVMGFLDWQSAVYSSEHEIPVDRYMNKETYEIISLILSIPENFESLIELETIGVLN